VQASGLGSPARMASAADQDRGAPRAGTEFEFEFEFFGDTKDELAVQRECRVRGPSIGIDSERS